MLASNGKDDLQRQVQAWSDRLAQFGLRLNVNKTEYVTPDANEGGTIKVDEQELSRTTAFKYLGSTITANGDLGTEVTTRVNAAWLQWRAATGILCDKRIKERIKAKIYRSVVRPVALYGVECWPTTKDAERRLTTMETRMLRRTVGVTRLDRLRNKEIRSRFGVAPITDKLHEAKLRWYGHVLRADDNSIAKRAFNLEVKGRRPRGRPRLR